MDKEYVLRISSRDPRHRIAETTLVELGFDAGQPRHMLAALQALTELISRVKTPEQLADLMATYQTLQLTRVN